MQILQRKRNEAQQVNSTVKAPKVLLPTGPGAKATAAPSGGAGTSQLQSSKKDAPAASREVLKPVENQAVPKQGKAGATKKNVVSVSPVHEDEIQIDVLPSAQKPAPAARPVLSQQQPADPSLQDGDAIFNQMKVLTAALPTLGDDEDANKGKRGKGGRGKGARKGQAANDHEAGPSLREQLHAAWGGATYLERLDMIVESETDGNGSQPDPLPAVKKYKPIDFDNLLAPLPDEPSEPSRYDTESQQDDSPGAAPRPSTSPQPTARPSTSPAAADQPAGKGARGRGGGKAKTAAASKAAAAAAAAAPAAAATRGRGPKASTRAQQLVAAATQPAAAAAEPAATQPAPATTTRPPFVTSTVKAARPAGLPSATPAPRTVAKAAAAAAQPAAADAPKAQPAKGRGNAAAEANKAKDAAQAVQQADGAGAGHDTAEKAPVQEKAAGKRGAKASAVADAPKEPRQEAVRPARPTRKAAGASRQQSTEPASPAKQPVEAPPLLLAENPVYEPSTSQPEPAAAAPVQDMDVDRQGTRDWLQSDAVQEEIERRVHQERVRGDKLQAQLDEAMDKLRTQGGQQEQRSKRKRASPSPEEQQMAAELAKVKAELASEREEHAETRKRLKRATDCIAQQRSVLAAYTDEPDSP